MPKRRIIAKLLIENGRLVKYRQFTEGKRIAGNAVSTAEIYEDMKLDELYFCDLGTVDPAQIAAMTRRIFTPVSVAGSIHSMDLVDSLFRDAGVDKVVLKDPELGVAVAAKYGQQAVILPVDYCGDGAFFEVPKYAGEVMLTSVDRDGMSTGMDLAALRFPYQVPTTLAGGVGKLDHVRQAFQAGASAVTISTMFFFTDKSPIKLRAYLHSNGVDVRL